jgi:peptide/nickel transport system substrate-binding protein
MDSGGRAPEVRGPAGGLRPSSVYRRRTALRAWCGVIFLSASAVLAGCESAQSGAAERRGVLRIGVPESGVNRAELGTGFLITNSTLEGLTQVNVSVDGRALPRLAERWAWQANGLQLRLELRQGVVFHDGTPLDGSSAARALKVAIAEEGNRTLYPSLADITDVRSDGQRALVIELSQPSAFLPEELDFPLTLGPNNGTGPFRLVSRNGSSAVLERFDAYYLGAPEIERIEVIPFDTLRGAWTNLLRGEVDMVTDVPPDAVEFISTDEVQVVPFARSYQFLIAFNSRRPLFASRQVRRALNLAIDRSALIADVLQGQGQAATGPLWPQHWAYDASVQPYPFDPDLAGTLLDSAGFRMGSVAATEEDPSARLRFRCMIPANFSLHERIGLDVQKQLFDIGVDVQFEVVPAAEYDRRIRDGDFESVLVDLISGPTFGRPFIFWRSARAFHGLNVFGYDNPEVERLFQVLRRSMNEAAVRSTTPRLQRALLDDPPALFLAWNSRARAVSRHFVVTGDKGRDPLVTIRQWTEDLDSPVVAVQ